jgi:hypothetical protein
MTQKRIVDAKQRRAEIMVATLFLVTAAPVSPRGSFWSRF